MGVTDVEFVLAEGVQVSPEHREKALNDALASAASISAFEARAAV